MLSYLKEYFADWTTWDFGWTIIATLTAVWLGIRWGEGNWNTVLSISTSVTGMWCVILVAKGRIFNYYPGIVNILGYSWISYNYKLYGEVMLNMLYFLPMSFIGIWLWLKHKNPGIKDAVAIKTLSWTARGNWAIGSLLATAVYGVILMNMGDPLPFLDSTSTILSIFAMFLMVKRYTEQWVMWIIVDIASVAMWWLTVDANGTRDIAILIMWIAYLINAIYGFFAWNRAFKKQAVSLQ